MEQLHKDVVMGLQYTVSRARFVAHSRLWLHPNKTKQCQNTIACVIKQHNAAFFAEVPNDF